MQKGYVVTIPVAGEVPYDNTASGLTATDVQAAIDEINSGSSSNSASPGFTFGRSGNIASGTYLHNDTVPSNISGRTILLNSASLKKIAYANDGAMTFDLTVEEHDGVTYTFITTQSVVASRAGTFTINFGLTTNKMLAVSVSAGSAKNLVVALVLQGTFV